MRVVSSQAAPVIPVCAFSSSRQLTRLGNRACAGVGQGAGQDCARHQQPTALQATSTMMRTTTRIRDMTISFIFMFCHARLRRTLLLCFWNVCTQGAPRRPQQRAGEGGTGIAASGGHPGALRAQGRSGVTSAWKRKLSVLSTRSSIFSPLARTCSMF